MTLQGRTQDLYVIIVLKFPPKPARLPMDLTYCPVERILLSLPDRVTTLFVFFSPLILALQIPVYGTPSVLIISV